MSKINNVTSSKLQSVISSLPDDAFSHLTYLVPQAGCPNACSFCSRTAAPTTLNLRPDALKAICDELHAEASKRNIAIGSNRRHKPGVIYPHYDNDPLSFPNWDAYVELIANMGLKIRVSSVGFSRRSKAICEKNALVAETYFQAFHGLRFSVSPFAFSLRKLLAKGRINEAQIQDAVDRYVEDLTNSVATYRPVQEHIGYGRDRFCIAARHAPRIETNLPFREEQYKGFTIVVAGNYAFGVRSEDYSNLQPAHVVHMDGRKGILENDGAPCVLVLAKEVAIATNLVKKALNAGALKEGTFKEVGFETTTSNALQRMGKLHLFNNADGEYYSIDPFGQVPVRFDSLNIYVKAGRRSCSILDSTRYGYSLIAKFKTIEPKNVNLYQQYLDELKSLAEGFTSIDLKISEYLRQRYIPTTEIVMRSFAAAGIEAGAVFGEGAFFHAGHAHNVGRANKVFRPIASSPNVSATPVEYKIENPDASVSIDRGLRWIIKPSSQHALTIATVNPETLELSNNKITIEFENSICDEVRFQRALEAGYVIGL